MKFTSFRDLSRHPRMRLLLAQRETKAKRSHAAAPSEDDLFHQAMRGVTPLSQSGPQVPKSPPPAPKERRRKAFADLLAENGDFDVELTHEYLHGKVHDLDPRVFRQLRSGQMSIEAHLDLHGMNRRQAKLAVAEFLRACFLQGMRCVLLVPGRGKNSEGGTSVLREELSLWLTQAPLKRIVLCFATAQPRHGGAGAVYVLLRQLRKGRGKIIWDELLLDVDG
ncbi:MAG: Smr/MutS family protein [Desulfomicrobiaceae bacterium]